MVLAFAERGANLVIVSRKAEACEELASHVTGEYGVQARAVPGNVSDWVSCDTIAEESYRLAGAIDVLVNNAGISPLYPNLSEVTEELFDKVIAVNLRGPFRLTANIGRRMRTAGQGSVINISSIEAVRPNPRALPYAAAKAGLNALTVGFAQEVAPCVRVNAIQAGPFLTDIASSWTDEVRAQLEDTVVLRRCGEPHEIVGAALYLAGPDSSFTTGSVIPVDGGLR
jgi:NAD(P)-dependent dehydrogenase (short-subunit alcohol dehydrogenase family)